MSGLQSTRGGVTQSTLASPDWAQLYLECRGAMYAIARRVLRGVGRTDLADDVVQDAILYALLQPEGSIKCPRAFLTTATHHRAVNVARLHDNLKRSIFIEQNHVYGDIESDTVHDLDCERRARFLHQEIDALPLIQRYIVLQVIVHERRATDVATDLGLSKGRVSQLQKEALLTLRNRLKQELGV